MKKILIVNIGTEIGGIEKCLINFLKYLETKECEVDLALWKPAGPLFSQIPKSINVLPNLGTGSLNQILHSKNKLSIPKKLFQYIQFKQSKKGGCPWKTLDSQKKEYDIAISYCQNGYSPYYVIDNVKAEQKYLWYHELNYIGNYDTKNKDLEYFQKYTKIICVSNACRKNLSKVFPSISENFITLYNLYNTEEIIKKANLENNPFDTDKNILVTVGRISPEKGFELAINACYELSKLRNDFIWYWVGSGQCHDEAQKLINELEINEYMVLLGNKENPYPYIKNCNVYIQPSLSEAYCTTIIEAKILNKPIVSTNVESIYEQIEQTSYSVITDKTDVDLAKGIEKLLSFDILKSNYVKDCINDTKKYDELFELKYK